MSSAGLLVGLPAATAAADTGNLRFYQRQGFRMRSIERDAFTRRRLPAWPSHRRHRTT
jgi:hypothetical protein